ncbi:MAG TPA: hypothetical protein VFH07_09825 [Chitinophagaceae bacterium]|jgi:hypothetical protein|nr:hypothetical protein [Chitinophagaceae bacterium]
MKTIFTLVAFSLIGSLAVAGERHPEVKVTSNGEYIIIVDGKRFNNEKKISLTGLKKGTHYIDVFKKKKGLFGSKYKLVSSKQFELGNKDLDIDVNFSGYITIGKQGKGWDGDYWLRNGARKE